MANVIQARPTLYNGIRMRSRLEADFAAILDRAPGWKWTYEPTCFAGPAGQWLPDFRMIKGHDVWYVEVKPAGFLSDVAEVDQLLERMETAWLSESRCHLHLCSRRYQAGIGDSDNLLAEGSARIWEYEGRGYPQRMLWPGRLQRDRLGRRQAAP